MNTQVMAIGEVAPGDRRGARRAPPSPPVTSAFGARRRPSLVAIGGVVAVHALLLAMLVRLDVFAVRAPPPKPMTVTLVPLEVAPPPPPETKLEPIKPPVTPIVAPPPEVPVPTPAPPPVATTPTPPPPQAIAVAPPAPAPADPGPPAPVTPPDASAASLRNPSPRYPLESRRLHEEGTVRLRVVITVEGRVEDIAVAQSSGSDRLDHAALETVRRWKFKPGMQAGKPVEAIGFLNIPFKLSA